ncbi:MAG TPA: diguanylate cyclase [Anaerolineaceae bacterium]|nr:diguanylate cyclase [Anaerolineaceae bacterium]
MEPMRDEHHPLIPGSLETATNLALLASIIETAEDAILVLDSDLRVVLFNPAAEKTFGVPQAEMLGQSINRFLPPKMGAWHDNKVREFAGEGEVTRRMGLTHEVQGIRASGERFPIEASLSVFEKDGEVYYTAIIRDITSRKVIENELRFLSTHDVLTGLFNRLHFEEQLERLKNGRSYPISVVIADVDGLKHVNDTYGHAMGDELIRTTAQVLKNSFRAEDIIARLGGDEFGMILPLSDEEITQDAVQRIYANLTDAAIVDSELPFTLSLSIGASTAQRGDDLSVTVREADRRMYRHKATKAHRRID